MRIRNRLLAPIALSAVVLFGVGSALPAFAAGNSPSPAPSASKSDDPNHLTVPVNNLTFAVGTSDGKINDGRAVFRYSVDPGQVIHDNVVIYNLGKVSGALVLYASDAVTSADGTFTLSKPFDKQTGFGSWVKMSRRVITLNGGQSTVVPFTITVPKDALPGDTVGGVVISSIPKLASITQIQQALSVATRIGVRSIVRVKGDLHASLSVSNLHETFEPNLKSPGFGKLTVSYRVTNDGNLRVSSQERIGVSALIGGSLETSNPSKLDQILPKDHIDRTFTFDNVFAGVRLTTEVTATPAILEGQVADLHVGKDSDSIWAISPTAVAIVTLIFGLFAALAIRIIQRRKNGGPSGGHTDSGGGAPSPDLVGSGVQS